MKYFNIFSINAIALLISCTAAKEEGNKAANVNEGNKHVTIQWGDSSGFETATVTWYEGITALTALQNAAIVETIPVGNHIFVTSINGKHAQRGTTAWYYNVNGNSPGKLAFRNQLQENVTVQWIFKKDVCSPKFDSLHCSVSK